MFKVHRGESQKGEPLNVRAGKHTIERDRTTECWDLQSSCAIHCSLPSGAGSSALGVKMTGQVKHKSKNLEIAQSLLSVLVAQSCLTRCDSMNCSLSGSSVHGILQVRILQWVAISFSNA